MNGEDSLLQIVIDCWTYNPLSRKHTQNVKTGQTRHFEILQKNPKNVPHVVFDEESKTGHGLEFKQRQPTC